MLTTPELVAVVQRERDASAARSRVARLASRVRACCDPSRVDRLARALHLRTASC
jgi:hypothetical protein